MGPLGGARGPVGGGMVNSPLLPLHSAQLSKAGSENLYCSSKPWLVHHYAAKERLM